MSKYYAVKSGRHTGIFHTWEECRKEVIGYSGAEYKSFTCLDDAKRYIIGNNSDVTVTGGAARAYVDGSFNIATHEYSYGAVIFYKDETVTASEKFSDPELALMRNVAGEIAGAMKAMSYCIENGINALEIYYDYAGIEKWCTGEWKTNKSGTAAYKKFYDDAAQKLHITFHKVKGHSGDKYNDMADALAKEALGIKK